MPRELFDGFGNKVWAYSGKEYATLLAQKVELEEEVKRLGKQLKTLRGRKRKGLATE